MHKYFDYEVIDEAERVKFIAIKLRGHVSIWWDGVQVKKRSKGKAKIKSWSKMVTKIKGKFIPRDYQLSLFTKMKNLRQKLMTIKEYTKDFL